MASGVALRLVHAGFSVIICELPQPLTIRRTVSFSEAVYDGAATVEDVQSDLIKNWSEANSVLSSNKIAVIIDPEGYIIHQAEPEAVIDARLIKSYVLQEISSCYLQIGLGPGFIAKKNCDVVIETNRGHNMGRVFWDGSAQADTGIPGEVRGYCKERVIYSQAEGKFIALKRIGDQVSCSEAIAYVDQVEIKAPFTGILRGMLHDGLQVSKYTKVADVDPRTDLILHKTVSEKTLAIGGGVLEAILHNRWAQSQKMIR